MTKCVIYKTSILTSLGGKFIQGRDPIQTTEAKHFKRQHLRYTYVLKSPSTQGICICACIHIYIYILSTLSKSTILEVRVKYMNVSAEQIGRRKIDNKNRSE